MNDHYLEPQQFILSYLIFLDIQKVLIKLAKEKDCEVRGRWRKACVRQFYGPLHQHYLE